MARSTKALARSATAMMMLSGCTGLQMPDAVRSEQAYPTRPATTFFTAALTCAGKLVEDSLSLALIIVPDVRDGDEPTQGTHPGLGPRRLANDMLVVAVQNLGTRKVTAAMDLPAARKHQAELLRYDSLNSVILIVSGGTLAQDDIRARGVEAGAGSSPFSGSMGWNQTHGQFHMSLAVFRESAVSIPGLGVELNAVTESRNNQVRLGISTGTYELSLGVGGAGTSATRAQVSQLLFQAALMQIVGRASGVDISSCIAWAHAVAEPYLHGLTAGAGQRASEGEAMLIRLGLLGGRGADQQARALAVAGFQRQQGLPVTGFIDETTFAALRLALPR